MKLIDKNPDWGIRILGLVDIDPGKKGKLIEEHEVLGSLEDFPELLHENVVDEVVFIVPRLWLNKIEEPMLYCESAGLKVYCAVNLFDLKFSKAKQTDLQGIPFARF